MKEPTRLVDLSANQQVVALLQAGASEQPSDQALQRALLLAAAVGGGLAATAGTASSLQGSLASGLGSGPVGSAVASSGALSSLAKAGLKLSLTKWLAVTALAVSSAVSVPKLAHWLSASSRISAGPPQANATTTLGATHLDPVVQPTVSDPIAQTSITPMLRRRETTPVASGNNNFSAEVRLVEAARAAIRDGAAERGLKLLAGYEAQYPRQQLLPEVLVLRLEALSRLGRGKDAKIIARRILASDATGTHARQARAVLNQ